MTNGDFMGIPLKGAPVSPLASDGALPHASQFMHYDENGDLRSSLQRLRVSDNQVIEIPQALWTAEAFANNPGPIGPKQPIAVDRTDGSVEKAGWDEGGQNWYPATPPGVLAQPGPGPEQLSAASRLHAAALLFAQATARK